MRATTVAALVAATLGASPVLAQAQAPADAGAASTVDAGAASASATETATATATAPATDTHELPPEEPKAPKKNPVPVPLSIMGGLRGGVVIPAGDIGQSPVPVAVDPAVDLTLEVGATIYEHFYGGLLFGGTFFISPATTSPKSVNAILFGTEVGYLTNPDGLGGFFGLGLGYRRFFIGDALGNANAVDGPDVLATVALHIRAGSAIRLLPRFDFATGPAGGFAHALFFFGLSIWLNHDVWKKR